MKKNNKGFFLAETIVVIALVTTVMAFVYPNVTKLYENYKNRANYYDQTEDLYALRAVYDLLENEYINFVDKPATDINNINPNDVRSINVLGFLTYEGCHWNGSSCTKSASAGCLKFSDPGNFNGGYLSSSNTASKTRDLLIYNNSMLQIYDKNWVGADTENGIGRTLTYIRQNNTNDKTVNNHDLFTCYGDYVGQYNSYNLDEALVRTGSAGPGLYCTGTKNTYNDFFEKISLKELYITDYMALPSSNNYNFNKYLKRLKKTNYDSAAYRLIGVFEKGAEIRYASIKVDNPNPNRNCNLGG